MENNKYMWLFLSVLALGITAVMIATIWTQAMPLREQGSINFVIHCDDLNLSVIGHPTNALPVTPPDLKGCTIQGSAYTDISIQAALLKALEKR